MSLIESLCAALDEVAIARDVGIPHDEARAGYGLRRNTVSNFNEFNEVITNYYAFHVAQCVIRGGRIPQFEATGRANAIVEQEFRRQGGNLQSACRDALDGTNGGLRAILDVMAEHLKAESVERYTQYVFQQHVDPTSWPQKVEIIRQFIDRYRHVLGTAIDDRHPERYAQNYDELIRAFVDGLKRSSRIFKRF